MHPAFAAGYITNPNNDFTATFVNDRTGRITGHIAAGHHHLITTAPLSTRETGDMVMVTGYIDDVRVFNADVLPRAALTLDSGSGASVIVDIRPNLYSRTWGDLVIGRPVRIMARIFRFTVAGAPTVLTMHSFALLGGDAR
ncbi:hypothetical protein ADL27_53250 [Streptomyces sp. NRRL F-6602]|nr:hypothetical protein ADL27_53250 [Streptomyces sp. NRRL F-6602]